MPTPESDQRSPERRVRDEKIAAGSPLAPLDVPPETPPSPMEAHLGQQGWHPPAIGPGGDIDREVAALGGSEKFMPFLEARSKETGNIPISKVREKRSL